MTTQKNWSAWQVCKVVGLWCLLIVAAPLSARGQGSMVFNGTSSPSAGTSKLENTTANVVGGDEMTICAWVYSGGVGEGYGGTLFVLDEAASGVLVQHYSSPGKLVFGSKFSTAAGAWSFPVNEDSWCAVAITYDMHSAANDPTVRVNFSDVVETEDYTPSGSSPTINTGYCVGNDSSQSYTWQGRIAHVQVFNRILSAAEMDACLHVPGSVTSGLRLWLPMANASDTNDKSGNSFHGTATDIVAGANGPLLANQPVVPKGITWLPEGTTSLTQYVIPRYSDGSNHPAGHLRGWGAQSVLQATSATENLPSATRSIIITQGLTDSPLISQWQQTSTSKSPAVLQPKLADCTIAGYPDYQADPYHGSNSYVNTYPQSQDQNDDDKYDGFRGLATGGIIDNVTVFYVPGTAIDIGRPNSDLLNKTLPYDRLKWTLSRINVRRVFRGIYNHAVDSYMHDIEVESARDYGVRMDSAVQFARIHTFGVGYAAQTQGGPGIWLENDDNHGGQIYVENGPIGLRIDGKFNVVTGVYSHTCATNNIRFEGPNSGDPAYFNAVSQFDLSSTPVNVLMAADGNNLTDGFITLQDSGKGIHITANPAKQIVVRGVNIAGYQEARNDHLADSFAGSAIAIDADGQLESCDIHVTITDCTTGIDFGGGIGTSNRIWINTRNVTTPVVWPAGQTWNDTVKTTETNDIRINGVRYYKQ